MAAIAAGRRLVGSVLFVAALNHKQMSLFFAPDFFAHLLGWALHDPAHTGLGRKVCRGWGFGVVDTRALRTRGWGARCVAGGEVPCQELVGEKGTARTWLGRRVRCMLGGEGRDHESGCVGLRAPVVDGLAWVACEYAVQCHVLRVGTGVAGTRAWKGALLHHGA